METETPKVLLVDDNETNIDVLQRRLERRDPSVGQRRNVLLDVVAAQQRGGKEKGG